MQDDARQRFYQTNDARQWEIRRREREDNDKNRLILKFSMSRYDYHQVVVIMNGKDNVLMMQLCVTRLS